MKLTSGSIITIGPYRLILDTTFKGQWNLRGTHEGRKIEVINYITKSPYWNRQTMTEALESGDFMLICKEERRSLYDGRREKGKYKIGQTKKGILRWLWRNR